MSRFKPVAVDVEKAVVGPIAWGDEEDEEEHGAVDARPIEEVGQEEEWHDESGTIVNTLPVNLDLGRTHNGDAFVGMKRSGSQLMVCLANLCIFSTSAKAFTSVSRTWSIESIWCRCWICNAVQTPWWLWGSSWEDKGKATDNYKIIPSFSLSDWEVQRLSPACAGRPCTHAFVQYHGYHPRHPSVANTFRRSSSSGLNMYHATSLDNPDLEPLLSPFQNPESPSNCQARREIGTDRMDCLI